MSDTMDRDTVQADSAIPLAPASSRPHPRQTVRTSDGGVVAYARTDGRAPDVLLVHGAMTTLDDMWLGLAPCLAPRFGVVAVDRPGHGESSRHRLLDASPWRQARIIHDAMLALGVERPTVVGHSAGGAVALAYALLFPDEVAGAVALAPICYPEIRLEQVLFGPRALPLVGEAMAWGSRVTIDPLLLPLLWRAMFLPQPMPARFAAMFPFDLAGRPAQMLAEGEDALALGPALVGSVMSYPTCTAPVEILAGEADIVVNPWRHAFRAAQLIPGARFRGLRGIGHMLHHFCQSEVLDAVASVRGRA